MLSGSEIRPQRLCLVGDLYVGDGDGYAEEESTEKWKDIHLVTKKSLHLQYQCQVSVASCQICRVRGKVQCRGLRQQRLSYSINIHFSRGDAVSTA